MERRERDLYAHRLAAAIMALELEVVHQRDGEDVANRVAQTLHGNADVEVEEMFPLNLVIPKPPEIGRAPAPGDDPERPVDDDHPLLDTREDGAEERVRLQ